MSTNNIHRQRESLTSSQRRLMNKELKKQMIRARECGWRSSTPMAAQRIPYYNAINDQYCSITDSKVFRSAQRKLRKRMKKGSHTSSSLFNKLKRQRAQQLIEQPSRPGRGVTSMATGHDSSAFSFASPDFHIKSRGRDERTKRAEMEVLKMILVREGYVRRLKAVSKRLLAGDRTPFRIAGGSGLIDLLVQTRSASLAVVHGITLWRDGLAADVGKREKIACENDGEKDPDRKQTRIRNAVDDARKEPFMWNGINYMLKMCDDTDFLADVYPLVSALGIDPDTMVHNPFMMPQNLDMIPRPPPSRGVNNNNNNNSSSNNNNNDSNNKSPDAKTSENGSKSPQPQTPLSPQIQREMQQKRDEEHVQAMAWVLIREEKRERRRRRRDRQKGNSRGGNRSRNSSARSDQRRGQEEQLEATNLQPPAGMLRPGTQGGSRGAISASSSTNMRQGSGAMFQRRRDVPSGGRLHPLMNARIGSSSQGSKRRGPSSPAGGMGTYLSMDQLYPPNSRGEIQMMVDEQNSSLGTTFTRGGGNPRQRSRLSWQEQAKYQMEALARSLETSAWPENAATGRMGKLKKNKRKKKRMEKNKKNSQSMPNMLGGGVSQKKGSRRGESGAAYIDAEQMHMRQREMKLAETRRRRQTRAAREDALSRKEIVALAALTNPPPAIVLVSATVMILLSPGESVPEDLSWTSLRRSIADVDHFLHRLRSFRGTNIPRFKIRALQPFLCNDNFDPELLDQTSMAAAALCAWALQIVRSRPQYMEWLGAEGAEALRLKTPGGMQRDDDEYDGRRGRGQYRSDDDRYDSDVTDDYRSEESGGEWSNSYGSDEYSSDIRSRDDRYDDEYGRSDDYEEEYSDDIEEDDDDVYSDGFVEDGNASLTSGEGNVYKDDFEGADDPNDLLENAFGGPNEPQRYVGDGLGRVNKGKKSHRKGGGGGGGGGGAFKQKSGGSKASSQQQQISNDSNTIASSNTNTSAVAHQDEQKASKEEENYEEDNYEDEFENDEVVSKKSSMQNEKGSLAQPPPQEHFSSGRPGSQKMSKRPDSRSQRGDSGKQSAASSVGMNHEQRINSMKQNHSNTSSQEQLAFMGRDVLCSLNIGLKEQLYFVTVYDLPLEALAFEAKEEESGKKHVIELDYEDLKLACGKKYKRLLQPGHRMKLANKVATWLTDEGPYPIQIVSPNATGTVFSQSIEDRMKKRLEEDKYKIQKEEAQRKKLEEQKELKRVQKEAKELEARLERERKEREELEKVRMQKEKEEAERAAEAKRLEDERIAKEKAAEEARLAEIERQRVAEEKRKEEEKLAAEKAKKEAEEKARKEEEERKKQEELKRIEDERLAKEAAEKQRIADEEAAKKEKERLEEEEKKKEEMKLKLEAEKKEAEEAQAKEQEQQAKLKAEQEKLEQLKKQEEEERKRLEEIKRQKQVEEAHMAEAAKQEQLEAERKKQAELQKKQKKEAAEARAKKEAEEEKAAKLLSEKSLTSVDEYGDDDFDDDFEEENSNVISDNVVEEEGTKSKESSKIMSDSIIEEDDEDDYGDDGFESSQIREEESKILDSKPSTISDDYGDDFEDSTQGSPIKLGESITSTGDDYGDDFE